MNSLKDKTEQDLKHLIVVAGEKLRAFRFAMNGSKQKNVKEGKGLRKEIARMLTELNQR